jgi:hypothetical protein
MRDQAVERRKHLLDQRAGRGEIVAVSIRRRPQPRLFHEGGREGEAQRLLVETGQHHLAALGQPPDQRVEQLRVARGVVDAW